MAAPAASLFGQADLDLFALDTRDFGEPDPDQPDPLTWAEDGDAGEESETERARRLPLAIVPRRSLREHVNGVDAILESLDALDELEGGAELDAERDALSAQLISAIAGTKVKVDATAKVLAMFESLEAAAASEVTRLQKRAARFAGQRERLTDYVLATLEASKLSKMDGETSTLARRANPAKVEILDARAIPREYLRHKPAPPPEPDKTAIGRDLKKQRDVPGARLAAPSFRLVRS